MITKIKVILICIILLAACAPPPTGNDSGFVAEVTSDGGFVFTSMHTPSGWPNVFRLEDTKNGIVCYGTASSNASLFCLKK